MSRSFELFIKMWFKGAWYGSLAILISALAVLGLSAGFVSGGISWLFSIAVLICGPLAYAVVQEDLELAAEVKKLLNERDSDND